MVGKRRDTGPYLDVMTVQSRRYIAHADLAEEVHTKLLVEPIHIPDLHHTGIAVDGPGSVPLFYPNGAKNVHLRAVVQQSLTTAASTSALPVVAASRPLRTSVSLSQLPDAPSPKRTPKKTPKAKGNSHHLYVHRDKATAQHYKAKDSKTRDILATVRLNTTKITNLVNPHGT
ncbi:hypothetical protein ACHHYP_02481 [Achlya hypogyna]|uniref:Uncharacterized protein n=1 Tax=Achlya hypogyna TaxID=1202772 RepID=A0A1V9Z6H9_ACHHY|nr:hypothetical protein ACHHYP_02481 [Achlya hypogyna]